MTNLPVAGPTCASLFFSIKMRSAVTSVLRWVFSIGLTLEGSAGFRDVPAPDIGAARFALLVAGKSANTDPFLSHTTLRDNRFIAWRVAKATADAPQSHNA